MKRLQTRRKVSQESLAGIVGASNTMTRLLRAACKKLLLLGRLAERRRDHLCAWVDGVSVTQGSFRSKEVKSILGGSLSWTWSWGFTGHCCCCGGSNKFQVRVVLNLVLNLVHSCAFEKEDLVNPECDAHTLIRKCTS